MLKPVFLRLSLIKKILFLGRAADPDPAFHFNAEPDPDPAHHQNDGNIQPLVFRPSRLHFEPPGIHFDLPEGSILSLQASIVSVHGSILSL